MSTAPPAARPSTVAAPKPASKTAPAIPWYKRLLSFIGRTCMSIVEYWWAWEILGAILSIAATASLIAVLAYEDGRVQQPLPFGATTISLNTIVAALSTVIRTSLAVAIAGPLNQSAWNWFSSFRSSSTPPAGSHSRTWTLSATLQSTLCLHSS